MGLETQGASEFAIADVTGHSSLDTTRIYMRDREKRIRGAQGLLVRDVFPESGKS